MTDQSVSSRLMVLMFTDVVGSTRLRREIGPDAYRELASRHDELIRQSMAVAPTGKILQDTGDGYFIGFENISDAVKAALVFQWLMHKEQWPHTFSCRVGMDLGQVEEMPNPATGQSKYMAGAADMASRIMSLAHGGQLLLTRSVFDEARQVVRSHPPTDEGAAPALRWIAHGPYQFKGNDEPVDVFEVGADGMAPFAPPVDSEKAKRYIRPGDEVTLGWRPAVGTALANSPHWVISKMLGEGGFGEVWLAVHSKARTTRAFKFCFDAERLRALKREVALFRLLKDALGDRSDIAPVRDWNFDQSPYYIEMEYTPGGNLAQWFEAQGGMEKISLERRLGIVAGIARALAAAHSVGVLHKDIKPSNVLMMQNEAGEWYPRLTDFGIGILTDRSKLADRDITPDGFTDSQLTVNESSRTGTRMYAPPESMSRKPHTVQGDVYSLGVLLFQMTVGDLNSPLASGWERRVGDELLRQDIAQCVDVDPARRFASSGELSQRLEGLPARRIERAAEAEAARLQARRQRARRLLRSAVAATCVLLLLAAVATIYHVRNLNAERDRTKSVLAFLTDEVLANAAPERIHDAKVLEQIVTQLIDPAANDIGTQFKDKPLIEADIRHVFAVILRKAGRADQALPQIEKALAIRKRELGENNRATLTSEDFCAVVLESVGRSAESEAMHKDTMDRRTRTLGADDPDTLTSLNNYAMELKSRGHAQDALKYIKDALEGRQRVLRPNDPDTLMSLNNYALILQATGDPAAAEPLHLKALNLRTEVLGPDHPDTLSSLTNYALVINSLGQTAKAEPLLKKALEGRKRVLGPNHRNTFLSQIAYAYILTSQGKTDEAEPLFKEVMDRSTDVNGRNHPMTLAAMNGYVIVLDDRARADKAEPFAKELLELATANPNLGPKHPDTLQYAINCAKTLEIMQHNDEAEAIRAKYHVK